MIASRRDNTLTANGFDKVLYEKVCIFLDPAESGVRLKRGAIDCATIN